MRLVNLGFFVKDSEGECIARTAGAEEAAMLVSCLGEGYIVTANGLLGWEEGKEKQSASESYDFAAEIINRRTARR